jgi:hypothetical protein
MGKYANGGSIRRDAKNDSRPEVDIRPKSGTGIGFEKFGSVHHYQPKQQGRIFIQ